MALNIFGASGGGGGGGAAAIGGLGGFLSGGPIGAGLGILGGLLGSGDQKQESTYEYSTLSPLNRKASNAASRSLPALLAQLDPSVMDAFIKDLSGELGGAATTRVEDTFRTGRGAQRAGAARSGGMLSTVQNTFDIASGDQESKALIEALLGSRLTAEQIGGQRTSLAAQGVGAATGAITGIDSTRRLMKQTGAQAGNTTGDMLSGAMGALSDPLSAFNSGQLGTNYGAGRYKDFLDSILGPAPGDPGRVVTNDNVNATTG